MKVAKFHSSLCAAALTLMSFIAIPNYSINYASASHPIPVLDGTVTAQGCEEINGTIFSTPIDTLHKIWVDICNADGVNLGIAEARENCESQGDTMWVNPKTGEEHTISSDCDIPIMCGSGDLPQADQYRKSASRVNVENQNFTVYTASELQTCNTIDFSQQDREIRINSRGQQGSTGTIDVIIPTDLLSGNFTIFVAGAQINDFETTNQGPATMLSIPVEYNENDGSAEIIIKATQVIPEFPVGIAAMIVVMAIILAILLSRLKGPLSSFYGKKGS